MTGCQGTRRIQASQRRTHLEGGDVVVGVPGCEPIQG